MPSEESIVDPKKITPENAVFGGVFPSPLGYAVWIRTAAAPQVKEGVPPVHEPKMLTKGIFELLGLTTSGEVSYEEGMLKATATDAAGKAYSFEVEIGHDFAAEVGTNSKPYTSTTPKGAQALEKLTKDLLAQIKVQAAA